MPAAVLGSCVSFLLPIQTLAHIGDMTLSLLCKLIVTLVESLSIIVTKRLEGEGGAEPLERLHVVA